MVRQCDPALCSRFFAYVHLALPWSNLLRVRPVAGDNPSDKPLVSLDVSDCFHYTHPMMTGPNRASDIASPAQKPNKILDRVFIAPLRISIDQLPQLLDLAGIGIAHLV